MRPLDGIRVLDMSRVLAGPLAGRIMADLGADVVKLEPPEGDVSRFWGEERHGLSGFYTQQNAGKRNVSVDLKAGGAVDLVVRLAASADVVLENFRPGVLERLGLGWDRLSAANPRLVMLSVSGYGHTAGPLRDRAAFAPVVQAEAGLVERQARLDGAPPTDPVLSIADSFAGLHGLVAVLAALRMRDRGGPGQHVDLAMLDAMLFTDDYAHHAADRSDLVRLGGELWPTADGPIMVAGSFRNTWARLRDVHHVPDPASPGDELASKVAARREAVGTWFASHPDWDSVTGALDAAGLAWGALRTTEEALHGEQAASRGVLASVDDRGGGRRPVVQTPYRFSAAESGVRGPAPHRGEHNAEVLAEWCSMGAADVAALEHAGVLRRHVPDET